MSSPQIVQLGKLCELGVLGFATHVEVTEIFANVNGKECPQNVFTIAVVADSKRPVAPSCLNPKRLRVPKLAGWSFGVLRYVLVLEDFLQKLNAFTLGGAWDVSGKALGTGKLKPFNPQYAPPDQAKPLPINRVLKNNFWNGSYIAEWADSEKALFTGFFETPRYLMDLAAVILPFAPIDISALPDRLGNILVQVPVTVVTSKFGKLRGGGYQVQIGWHPRATPRPLLISISTEFDEVITGFVSSEVHENTATLGMPEGGGNPKAVIWDRANELILGATGEFSFIEQIRFQLTAVGTQDPRTFIYTDSGGTQRTERLDLRVLGVESSVGQPRQDPNGGFTQRRIYKNDTKRLLTEKVFIQYGVDAADQTEHERAIMDLRKLITKHGADGAWLWDPYLKSVDVLETLFYSPHSGADLRALCSAKNRDSLNKLEFMNSQRAILDAVTGNLRGLKLEYRAAHSLDRIEFHDRFLIFPRKEQGALAWSLGTSVTQAGTAHHILQQVDDGQRVSDAFAALWDRLGAEHEIWKHP